MAVYFAVQLIRAEDPHGQPVWKMPSPSMFPLLHQTPLYHSHEQYQTIHQCQPIPVKQLPTAWDSETDVAYPTDNGYCVLEPVRWHDVVELANYCLRGDQYWIDYDIALTVATLEEHYGKNLEELERATFNPNEETLVEEFLLATRRYFK